MKREPCHWRFWSIVGKWHCQETGKFGTPLRGDWYVDWNEWRIW